ncbi:autotransporter outer membrane beta-barrel domain-containing protein [Mesorhizobium sp. B2-2-3]|uniref:autotransporter outer membrane beta-barrel domain-containing protein n=1 Tax=Mesorhizobium sp. B2-2-3 TaxID=2589963 RepID=UPI001128D35F|nr:autotransporter outer membrane beta-barrel domain-containing protein [Mesorhizobium sp. B2-2-3]TPM46200.1 autotransporter outer membrane beta-barrel domain-containing protein [Mesorhizobium sp. B2-2-3]
MRFTQAIAVQCAWLLMASGASAQVVQPPIQHNFETYSGALDYLLGNGGRNTDCKFANQEEKDLTTFGFVDPLGGNGSAGDRTRLGDDSVFISHQGLIGPNLSRHCSPNTENSQLSGGSALGGGMSSLQSTRTVSQFDLNPRRAEPCDPSKNPDCKDSESETLSNYFYQVSLPPSANASFSLQNNHGVLDVNTLIPFDGFSVFGQFEYENYRQSSTIYEPSRKIDIFTAQFGAQWNISDDGIVGFKGTYSTGQGVIVGPKNVAIEVPDFLDDPEDPPSTLVLKGDFKDLCGVPSDGTIDSDEFGGSIFYQTKLRGNGFLVAELGASKMRANYSNSLCNIDVGVAGHTTLQQNTTAGIISGSPHVYGLSADVKAGYDWEYNGLIVGPRLAFDAFWKSIDGYSETEEHGTLWVPTGASLRYEDQDITSIQTRIGLAVSTPLLFDGMTVVPFAQLDYIHEFANDQRAIRASFVEDGRPDPFIFSFKTNPPDRNFFELRGGVAAEIFHGGVAYIDGRAFLANDLIDDIGVTAGLRVAF